MLNKLNLPTEWIAYCLSVTVETVLEWKLHGDIPSEYNELLESIPDKSLGIPNKGYIVFFEDCPELVAMVDARKNHGWGLLLKDSVDTTALSMARDSFVKEENLASWLVLILADKNLIDVVWKLTSIAGGSRDTKLTVSYPDNTKKEARIASTLRALAHSTVIAERKQGNFQDQMVSFIQATITKAQMADTEQAYQAILENADIDPAKVLEEECLEIASTWVNTHVRGVTSLEGVRQKPQPIYTTINGTQYSGRVQVTDRNIGTIWTEVRKGEENITPLYTGNGILTALCSHSDLSKSGLVSIVPSEKNINGGSSLDWLIPGHVKALLELIKRCNLSFTPDYCIQRLEEATMQVVLGLKNSLGTEDIIAPGISYLHDQRTGVSKISKDMFNLFPLDTPIPRPFKPFSASLLANEKVFWGLLYSSIIPHEKERKSLLYLCGSGGSFKSTIISKLYKNMLSLTVFLQEGKLRIKRNPNKSIPVVQLTTSGDIEGSENFGDQNNQHYVAKVIEEVKAFNIESKRFLGLKKQLGNNVIAIKKKFANGVFQIPISQTCICDSNFSPINPSYLKESIDRVAECVVFSQSFLLTGQQEFKIRSSNEHLFFDVLLSEEECAEAKELLDKEELTKTDIEEIYLPFLLFKTILTHGRMCYEALTGIKQFTPNYLQIDATKVDRKELATAYIAIGQFSEISSGAGRKDVLPTTTPNTLLAHILRASLKDSSQDCLTESDLENMVKWLFNQIKDSYDKDSRAAGLKLLTKFLWAELLSSSRIDNFIGNTNSNYQLINGDEGRILTGFTIEEWAKPIFKGVEDSNSVLTLVGLQELLIGNLRGKYLANMEALGVSDLIPRRIEGGF